MKFNFNYNFFSLPVFLPLKSILLTNFFYNLYVVLVCGPRMWYMFFSIYINTYIWCVYFEYIFLINRAQTQTFNNIFSGFQFVCPAVCWATKQLQIVFICAAATHTPHMNRMDLFTWCSQPPGTRSGIQRLITSSSTFVVVAFSIFRLQIGKVQTHTQPAGQGEWERAVDGRWSRPGGATQNGDYDLTKLWVSDSTEPDRRAQGMGAKSADKCGDDVAALQSCWPMHSGRQCLKKGFKYIGKNNTRSRISRSNRKYKI